MPVGIAIIIVAAVKYARVSISVPIVNIWWTQNYKSNVAILTIA